MDGGEGPSRAEPERGRRGRSGPRGRAPAEADRAFVAAVLPGALSRDRLIEYLHLLQDRGGGLSAGVIAALAERLRVGQAEVFEVASFYHHFALQGAGVPRTRVCQSVVCMLAGPPSIPGAAPAPCLGACDRAPVVVDGFVPRDRPVPAPDTDMAAHLDGMGMDPGALIAMIEASGLRGMGGAGFPTGRKWGLVRAKAGPRLMCVNADEGEPGTFKDRWILETQPGRFLAGTMVAAHAVGAERVVVYLRDEYAQARAILSPLLPRLPIPTELRRGAGAYICGEESSMIESIEGKRGLPRHRPPYVAEHGLDGRPTLVNNVETLWWVPEILARGPAWYAATRPRCYSLSGRVRAPGVKIAPASTTARRLIEDHGGGMLEGHRLTAYLPGGASGGILPERLADLPLDFGALEPHGCFTGSGAVVALSDRDDLKAVALNLMRFFRDESCGQCTPCRAGTQKAVTIMERGWDKALLDDLSQVMRDASICGLGQAAPNPIQSIYRHFPELVS